MVWKIPLKRSVAISLGIGVVCASMAMADLQAEPPTPVCEFRPSGVLRERMLLNCSPGTCYRTAIGTPGRFTGRLAESPEPPGLLWLGFLTYRYGPLILALPPAARQSRRLPPAATWRWDVVARCATAPEFDGVLTPLGDRFEHAGPDSKQFARQILFLQNAPSR